MKLINKLLENLKKEKYIHHSGTIFGGVDLADMQLISKFDNGIRFLLCVIDIFSKYAWVVPLKDKKGVTIVNAFHKVLDKPDRKPNKIWVNKSSELYKGSFKKWLKDNNIEIYSTQNEGTSAVAERFIRTLKSKIYKYTTSISKTVYIDKLDDIVNEYSIYHRTTKMKPVDVKSGNYAEYKVNSNDKDPKFKVGDHVRILKYKNIFVKGYTPIGQKTFCK